MSPWDVSLLFCSKTWISRPCSLASAEVNPEPCSLSLVLGQMNTADTQKRATLLLFIHESSCSGSSPPYFDNASDKGAGTSIIHLLTLVKSAHICCCTSRSTGERGAHCDLPAAPLHPHSQGTSPASRVLVPTATFAANIQSPTGQLCFSGKPAHRAKTWAARSTSTR